LTRASLLKTCTNDFFFRKENPVFFCDF
jgi:hypothetical protein